MLKSILKKNLNNLTSRAFATQPKIVPNFINGEFRDVKNPSETYPVISPLT